MDIAKYIVGLTYLQGYVKIMRYFCASKNSIITMNSTMKLILWWVFAVVFTVAMARYQKMTGPTYPVSGKAKLNNTEFKYSLIRSAENDHDAEIALNIPDTSIKGTISYKRFKSDDVLSTVPLLRRNDTLYFMMPKQPAAGKMMYEIELQSGSEKVKLHAKNDEFIVMRFKGAVPLFILIPHILAMFLGLLFSTRTAIEALISGARTYKLAIWTLVFLIIGGLILGPVVQKYAFGAYWTGWPFKGLLNFGDMTDNKTLIMVLAWVFAVIKLRKDPKNKFWPVIAAIMVLVVYLIPHSVLGSEIDHTKTPKP